jgi:hypothetical protein
MKKEFEVKELVGNHTITVKIRGLKGYIFRIKIIEGLLWLVAKISPVKVKTILK